MQFHRQQQEVKIKALESIVKLQGDRITRLQKQFDTSLAQMVKILVNQDAEEDDEEAMEQDAAADRQQAEDEGADQEQEGNQMLINTNTGGSSRKMENAETSKVNN